MPQILIYVLCAAIAIVANILLGGAIADFKREWDKDKCILGLKKAAVIIAAGAGLYCIGILMPDLVIQSLNLNLADALKAIAYAVVAVYVAKDIDNLMSLLKLKSSDIKPQIQTKVNNDPTIEGQG